MFVPGSAHKQRLLITVCDLALSLISYQRYGSSGETGDSRHSVATGYRTLITIAKPELEHIEVVLELKCTNGKILVVSVFVYRALFS